MPPNSFSPNTKAKSAEVNANFNAAAAGTSDADNNSMALMRAENLPSYAYSGAFWSQATGLNGAMSAGVVYVAASGRTQRVVLAVISSVAFTASKDTYVYLDSSGNITYNPLANGASYPSVPAGNVQLALVVTGASAITQIHNTVARSTYDGGMELGRCTLYAAADRMTVANLPVRKYLKLVCDIIPSGLIDIWCQLNNDTGGNYSMRYDTNNGTTGAPVSQTAIAFNATNAAVRKFIVAELVNSSSQEKLGQLVSTEAGTAGAGNNPSRFEESFKWANTNANVTRADVLNLAAGDMAAGSELIAYGHN